MPSKSNYQTNKLKDNDIVALMKTNLWTINIKLFPKEAPKTVTNFMWHIVNWYFDNLIFHRVIKDFMIQGGDPEWTWRWGVSIYWDTFEDEFSDKLKNIKWALSMANRWPNTNWSQFFIVHADSTPHLDWKHTVFWQVYNWIDIVDAIANQKIWPQDKPLSDVIIEKITLKIQKKGKLTKYDFDLDKELKKIEKERKKKIEANKNREVKNWDNISIHYTWTFDDWEVFDSSLTNGREPLNFVVGQWNTVKWFEEWVLWMKIWEIKKIHILPKDWYWEVDPKKTQEVKLTDFKNAWINPEVWLSLNTPYGPWTIKEVKKETVVLDLNHPLAWKSLNFELELMWYNN